MVMKQQDFCSSFADLPRCLEVEVGPELPYLLLDPPPASLTPWSSVCVALGFGGGGVLISAGHLY